MSETVQLSDIADIVRGISFPKEAKSLEARPGDVACLRTTNVQKQVEWDDLWFVPAEHVKRDEQYVKAGDILISTANSYELVGKVAPVTAVPHRATLGAFISLIRPRDRVEPKYLYHQLAWSKTQSRIRETASTTTNISNVSTKKLAALELFAPSLDEQRIAVAELEKQFSRLDEAVAGLQRVKANLKRYKAAVLKAAVEGRLVPNEAELARLDGRAYETGAQLLRRILEARRDKWRGKGKYKEPVAPDTTGLPGLPEGWVWATVDSISTKVSDGVHKKPNYLPFGIPFITVKNMTAGLGISFADLNHISEEDHAEFCRRTKPERGDILVSKDGTLGVIRLVDTDRPFSIFVSVALVKPVIYECSQYLVSAFESSVLQRQMVPKGSGLQHIHLEDLRADCVPLPPLAEQHRIVTEVDRRLSTVHEVENEVEVNLKRAQVLRQSLLGHVLTRHEREFLKS